jgi:CheY-like chemotaxis protein
MHLSFLDGAGLQIFTAENGHQAFEFARHAVPDVIVTDVSMPVVDGLELCRQIRGNAATRHIPVVVVTGDPSEQAEAVALNAGCDVVLNKPCSQGALLFAIRRLLARQVAVGSAAFEVPPSAPVRLMG